MDTRSIRLTRAKSAFLVTSRVQLAEMEVTTTIGSSVRHVQPIIHSIGAKMHSVSQGMCNVQTAAMSTLHTSVRVVQLGVTDVRAVINALSAIKSLIFRCYRVESVQMYVK